MYKFRNTVIETIVYPYYAAIVFTLCIKPDVVNSLIIAKNREVLTIVGSIG